jgi:hypothetical protein
MDIKDIRTSISSLRRNISKLIKKAETSKKSANALARAERKLASRLKDLHALGFEDLPFKAGRRKKKFSFKGYLDYINSASWESRRRSYFSTHERRCQACGTEERIIHLHHKTYDRLTKEIDSDLMPLCHVCHKKLHEFQKQLGLRVEEATSIWMASNSLELTNK